MLVLTSLALVTLLHQAPVCPSAFSITNTTIGAVSNSAQLSLCVSNAVLIKGANGSVSLAIGSVTSTAPRCLVYPNGLSPDLMSSLLQSGHVGCWSLYPPSQPVAIVNIGKPNQLKLSTALKSFRPIAPRIFIKPNSGILVGTRVQLSSSAAVQLTKTTLLGLPAQVRFKPVSYQWMISDGNTQTTKSTLASPSFVSTQPGLVQVTLAVTYSVEYLFNGLTSWNFVKPNILSNADPLKFVVSETIPPKPLKHLPRLVARPCLPAVFSWGC